jgi:NAD-dependent SIR2 family protein deacetylase
MAANAAELAAAAKWLDEADAVLICAGAGMSLNDGFNVYVSVEDFAKHYPWFPQWGYNTAYECMGLFADSRVPLEVKWGFWASHMHNMRWAFPPHAGYAELLKLLEGKDYFVYTSNVDGCFERSGFSSEKIYTPQGDWSHYQCMGRTGREGPCTTTSVFESRAMLDDTLPHIHNGRLPSASVPTCPKCGGATFGNVRGGNWYLHAPYDAANSRFVSWVEAVAESGRRLLVLEVGCGFNTPTVTRFPMEAIVRELSSKGAALVRVNPGEPQVPSDLPRAVGLPMGWQAILDFKRLLASGERAEAEEAERLVLHRREESGARGGQRQFDWRAMMQNLRR